MFSGKYIDITNTVGIEPLMQAQWEGLAAKHKLDAAMLVRIEAQRENTTVCSAYRLPCEPFNGSDRPALIDALSDCFKHHPQAHIHSIANLALPGRLKRYNHQIGDIVRAWFVPMQWRTSSFVFLGFPRCECSTRHLPTDFEPDLALCITTFAMASLAEELKRKLATTELFVKEVGHDIASSVQASVAKLRIITDGRITGDAVPRKTREIEDEIWSAYRVAEQLGVVVDPAYRVKDPEEFDLGTSANNVISHYTSEAAERHMRLKLDGQPKVTLWGDKRAIEMAIGQLVSNAIKYAQGGTDVIISPFANDEVTVKVSNKGPLKLPTGIAFHKLWDFGYRGEDAKDLHVNGSGIGLYSVKKIVTAHCGHVSGETVGGITTFCIHIPKPQQLKKRLNLLV